MKRGVHNQVTSTRHIEGVSLIAALCSSGELLFTANCGINNSSTFSFFLIKLCLHLDAEDRDWRKHTVLTLDNAQYHRGVLVKRMIQVLRIPVLYLGPYHFRMAPIEMVFNFIKSHDLNSL